MNNSRKIAEDTYYVGESDRRLSLFENIYPLSNGVSYNSYLIIDKKTVLLDTVDHSVSREFLDNVSGALSGRGLDYLIVNHMEPDHCAVIADIVLRYPEVKIIGNEKTMKMMEQFYTFDVSSHAHIVKDGDTFQSGNHVFRFIFAPMVHWPEVMVTFDETTGDLYSADAFGTFGALSGNLYADEVDFDRDFLDEARRYYINIVGKYGVQVTNLLNKASALPIKRILPLHGPIWRDNLAFIIGKYTVWASYSVEEKGLLIVYSSVYNNTASAASVIAGRIADRGVRNIHMYDASKTDVSYLVSEAFRFGNLVIACPTYNGEIFPKIEEFLNELKAHNYRNRNVFVIENGTWALSAGKKITEKLSEMKDIRILESFISIKSSLKDEDLPKIDGASELIASSILSS